MPIDIVYDEDNNPARPECLVSIEVTERWYKATVKEFYLTSPINVAVD